MPRASVWYLRTALLHLVLGFFLGTLLLANKGGHVQVLTGALLPLHIESLLVGAMVQFAMGTGFWILPRFRTGPERGWEGWVWAAYVLLNFGVLTVGLQSLTSTPQIQAVAGRIAELLAAVSYAAHAWPRVKGFGGTSVARSN